MSSHNKPRRHPQPGPQQPSQVVHQQASFYKGVIPKPEDLEHYERISPGFADRIIKITESEIQHRRRLEESIVNKGHRSVTIGQVLAFLSVGIVSALCYFYLTNGAPTQGA